jgi:hypothetical protein
MKAKCASGGKIDKQPKARAIAWTDVLLEIDNQIVRSQQRIADLKRSRKIVVGKIEAGEPFPIAPQKQAGL